MISGRVLSPASLNSWVRGGAKKAVANFGRSVSDRLWFGLLRCIGGVGVLSHFSDGTYLM